MCAIHNSTIILTSTYIFKDSKDRLHMKIEDAAAQSNRKSVENLISHQGGKVFGVLACPRQATSIGRPFGSKMIRI